MAPVPLDVKSQTSYPDAKKATRHGLVCILLMIARMKNQYMD